MAEVRLPPTLVPLFRDLPRRLEIDAATVAEALARLEERFPGVQDRLCEPGPALRRHIGLFVDGEPARLDSPLGPGSRLEVVAAISGG